ncbi:MAG: hypothetical protein M3154_04475, partial [Candidatus Eremiobacteraeota bacterium]|nr:hypothetical protein [Candidatus Eremiobacteraeota bacterium]
MVRHRVFVSIAGSFGLLCCGMASADVPVAVRPVSGAVIVTRTTPAEAGLMWDATPYVTQLVSEKITDERGMRALEATALRALADKGKALGVATLTLKVTYARTGAVSPVYKSVTFDGFESVMTIGAARAALARNATA